jgi:hypothetical protein
MPARRRANREGSIWQRQDGRRTGAVYVLTTAGTFRRAYVYGRTRDEVHARLVQLQDRSARGVPLPDHAWTVGEYLDYWLENIPARRSGRLPTPSTRCSSGSTCARGWDGTGWTGCRWPPCRPG